MRRTVNLSSFRDMAVPMGTREAISLMYYIVVLFLRHFSISLWFCMQTLRVTILPWVSRAAAYVPAVRSIPRVQRPPRFLASSRQRFAHLSRGSAAFALWSRGLRVYVVPSGREHPAYVHQLPHSIHTTECFGSGSVLGTDREPESKN
ncbi:hypothetical protein MRX96_005955 [Rhipicephalus microplus]